MLFTYKKNFNDSVTISIDGQNIEEVDCTKFLGVYIDNKLSWKKHIEYICGKVSRGIGIILRARHLLNHSALKTLYFSFVYPYFSYCNHVWGSTPPKRRHSRPIDSKFNRLFVLQKRAIRVISFAKYRTNIDTLFVKTGLLKLCDINKYAFGKFMFRWYHGKTPQLFETSFKFLHSNHTYGTRQNKHLQKPKVRTEYGKNRFLFRGPLIWNCILDAKVNVEVSESVYSKSVKQCLKVGLIKLDANLT